MTRIPPLPEGFTPELLTALLRAEGSLPAGGRVTRVACSAMNAGMMASISRLHLDYAGERGAAPPTLVAKYAALNPTNRQIALRYDLYQRETRFVRELGPRTRLRMPRSYCCAVEDDRFLILMEDLCDYGLGSQAEGATLAQAELAVDELTQLHAPFWNRADEHAWVPSIASSAHARNMQELAALGVDGVAERFGEHLPRVLSEGKTRFLAAIPAMQEWMAEPPTTLVHGDFRMENLLYGCRPEHDALVVIDWQGALRARGMADVALFLGQSAQTEVRRAHERALIARYVEGLRAGGVSGLDFDAAWADYRRSLLYSWVYALVVAGTLDASSDAARAWMSQMVARQAAASRDLDLFSLLP
jgi:hypothetical protein